jgi:hypothetical protein
VDCLDTSRQWLEATIVRVFVCRCAGVGHASYPHVDCPHSDASQSCTGCPHGSAWVFVHYNGWEARWDEWLRKNSPRLPPSALAATTCPLGSHCVRSPSTRCRPREERRARSLPWRLPGATELHRPDLPPTPMRLADKPLPRSAWRRSCLHCRYSWRRPQLR